MHRQFADRKHYMLDLFNHYLYNIRPASEHFFKVQGGHSFTLKLCPANLVGNVAVRAQLVPAPEKFRLF
jgi:hypothetical protein